MSLLMTDTSNASLADFWLTSWEPAGEPVASHALSACFQVGAYR